MPAAKAIWKRATHSDGANQPERVTARAEQARTTMVRTTSSRERRRRAKACEDQPARNTTRTPEVTIGRLPAGYARGTNQGTENTERRPHRENRRVGMRERLPSALHSASRVVFLGVLWPLWCRFSSYLSQHRHGSQSRGVSVPPGPAGPTLPHRAGTRKRCRSTLSSHGLDILMT